MGERPMKIVNAKKGQNTKFTIDMKNNIQRKLTELVEEEIKEPAKMVKERPFYIL
jgi:hypothetical protein